MSWDGRGMVGFPVGCVKSLALSVAFSKVVFLCLLALLDLVLRAWLALWDADLIDADLLEWELAGVLRTFREVGVVFSKVTFLHLFSFLLDLVLCLQLLVTLQDSELVDSDSLEWWLSGMRTCVIIAGIIVWSIMLSCDCSSFI